MSVVGKRSIGLGVGTAVLALMLPVGTASCSSPHKAAAGPHAEPVPGQTTPAPFVRPACSQLVAPTYDFRSIPDAPTVILSATESGVSRGPTVCEITGYIAPQEQFRLTLPVDNYSGVYMQEGCSSFCGQQIAEPATPSGQGGGTKGDSGSTGKCSQC